MAAQPEAAASRRVRKRPKEPSGRRSWWGHLAILALLPFVAYALYTVLDKSVQTYRLRHEASLVRAEIEAEKRENLRLQQELIDARSDQQVEDAARRYLNLVRPGDHAIVLSGAPPRPTATPTVPAQPSAPDDLPPWLSWLLTRLGL